MTKLQTALQDCLDLIQSGQATPEACLDLYPDLRAELEPLLRSAQRLGELRSIAPTPEFRERARLKLHAHMHANPRRPATGLAGLIGQGRLRMASAFLMLALAFFTTGTVLAQSALPGQALYGWKLQSEKVWASVSGEPRTTNLRLSERRADELFAVHGSQDLEPLVLESYTMALQRLIMDLDVEADPDFAGQVLNALTNQRSRLEEIGIIIPELDDAVLRIPDLNLLPDNDQGGDSSRTPANIIEDGLGKDDLDLDPLLDTDEDSKDSGDSSDDQSRETDDQSSNASSDKGQSNGGDDIGDVIATAVPDLLKP